MEKDLVNQITEELDVIVKDLDGLKKYKQEAIQQLADVKKELEGLKGIKEEITLCYNDLQHSMQESRDLLTLVNTTLSKAGDSTQEIKSYLDRMSAISNSMSGNLEDAKRLETRLMIEKMDLMLRRAESINCNTNISNNIPNDYKNNVKQPEKTKPVAKRSSKNKMMPSASGNEGA